MTNTKEINAKSLQALMDQIWHAIAVELDQQFAAFETRLQTIERRRSRSPTPQPPSFHPTTASLHQPPEFQNQQGTPHRDDPSTAKVANATLAVVPPLQSPAISPSSNPTKPTKDHADDGPGLADESNPTTQISVGHPLRNLFAAETADDSPSFQKQTQTIDEGYPPAVKPVYQGPLAITPAKPPYGDFHGGLPYLRTCSGTTAPSGYRPSQPPDPNPPDPLTPLAISERPKPASTAPNNHHSGPQSTPQASSNHHQLLVRFLSRWMQGLSTLQELGFLFPLDPLIYFSLV